MFCPHCGTQMEQQTKFCKFCGVKLPDHPQLLTAPREAESVRMSREEAGRMLRWLRGTRALVVSAMLVPITVLFTILTAASGGRDQDIFIAITFALLCMCMSAGGWGLAKILRSGFFKTFKERRIRAEAALLDPQPPAYLQPMDRFSAPVETNRISSFSPVGVGNSITEPTT